MKFSIYFNGRVLVMYSKVKVNKCHEKYNRDYRDRLENITRLFKYIGNFTTKNENFQIKKKSDISHISAQNIDCRYSLESPRRGSSDKHQQSMFLRRNKKYNVYPCKPQFYYIKVGFKGVKFRDVFYLYLRIASPVIRLSSRRLRKETKRPTGHNSITWVKPPFRHADSMQHFSNTLMTRQWLTVFEISCLQG